MSRALDSINNLLKYKLQREQQKIDRSLSLLDLGTKLRQEGYAREEQLQRMEIARSQELDRIERERDANELRDLQRNEVYSPEAIERRKEKAVVDLKTSKLQLDNLINNRTQESVDRFFSTINKQQDQLDLQLVSNIRRNEAIIPSPIFNYIENYWTGDESDLKGDIAELARKSDKSDEVSNFYKKENSQAVINSLIQAQVSANTTGRPNYDNFLNVFEKLDKSYFNNQIPFMNSLKEPVSRHNENKLFYSQQENRVEIENSLRQIVKGNVNKELDELLLDISESQKIDLPEDYIPFDIKQKLLDEGFTREEVGL